MKMILAGMAVSMLLIVTGCATTDDPSLDDFDNPSFQSTVESTTNQEAIETAELIRAPTIRK